MNKSEFFTKTETDEVDAKFWHLEGWGGEEDFVKRRIRPRLDYLSCFVAQSFLCKILF